MQDDNQTFNLFLMKTVNTRANPTPTRIGHSEFQEV